MSNIVIGVEGQVSAGKTSACKELIKLIDNCIFIDGGSIARAIVIALTKSGCDISKQNISSIDPFELMKKLNVRFEIENSRTVIYIDNREVTSKEIETNENAIGVSNLISKGNSKALFEYAGKIIDYYRQKYNIVVTARNLVAIYPNMTAHVYITADLDERVRRRYKQYQGKFTEDEIRKMIIKRDKIHEEAGFNAKCDRSVEVDITDCKTASQSAKKIYDSLKSRQIF